MESKLIATQSPNSLILDRQRIEDTAADSSFAMFSSIVILIAMAVSTCAFISKERQKSYTQKPCQKSPCNNCEYFDGNHYLNCAIHPTTVRTEAAIDCLDYCPNSKTRRAEELKKVLPFASKFFPNRSN
ncbi:hypothetical protein [Chamaesiphon sp. GL140_3_metabinner_50]|uniref:hypothetical protein n=1 Tax=Chamaesiphon sp. GL140_3_metabinner_50 TaxID=2970812 RepID=UPI0025EE287A|nr:hypothetical protein [Chamaesiphon sp. GL140_3_metabinner_50]